MRANDPANDRVYQDTHSSHFKTKAGEPGFAAELRADITRRNMTPVAYLDQEPRGVVEAFIRATIDCTPRDEFTKAQLDAIAVMILEFS